jgi:hypothetical protein
MRYGLRAWISNVNSWAQIRIQSPSDSVAVPRIRSSPASTPLADRGSVMTKLVLLRRAQRHRRAVDRHLRRPQHAEVDLVFGHHGQL